jgi:hypothetical protein
MQHLDITTELIEEIQGVIEDGDSEAIAYKLGIPTEEVEDQLSTTEIGKNGLKIFDTAISLLSDKWAERIEEAKQLY